MDLVEKRVKDRTLLRLIGKWLTVGYRDDNSSLLANIVLNEAMDKPVRRWRQQQASGEVYIVRYADDAVIGFEHHEDALALRAELEQTLQAYGLSLNEAKTRLLRFSRHDPPRGPGRSETFDFLGLTHIAGRDRKGRYLVKRKTARRRYTRSLERVKRWCQHHRHEPIAWQHKELSLKMRGHYAYYGVRGNLASLARFRHRVWSLWRQSLRRRSQTSRKGRITALLNERFVLPAPRITHPDNWLPVNPGYLLGRAGCGKAARPVL
jgi:hypothetical protein